MALSFNKRIEVVTLAEAGGPEVSGPVEVLFSKA